MNDGDFPLTVYRSGAAFDWDGRLTDCHVVHTQDELGAALGDGWQFSADYCRGEQAAARQPRKAKETA